MQFPLPKQNQMNNKIAFATLGFAIGIISMWTFMIYWNNPIHNWSTVIEDRCMYYEARIDSKNAQARQAIWDELQELNEIAYTNNTRVNNIMDPHGYYVSGVVREAAEMLYFAEYMWAENFWPMHDSSSSIDLPEPDTAEPKVDYNK